MTAIRQRHGQFAATRRSPVPQIPFVPAAIRSRVIGATIVLTTLPPIVGVLYALAAIHSRILPEIDVPLTTSDIARNSVLIGLFVLLLEGAILVALLPIMAYAQRQGRLMTRVLRGRAERRRSARVRLDVERRRSFGRLTAALAHDLNNVFGAILAEADAIEERAADTHVRAAMTSIVASVQSGISLSQRALAYGEAMPFNPAMRDIVAVLERATPRLYAAAGGAALLTIKSASSQLLAYLDSDRFITCVEELILNARAASRPDQQILLETRLAGGDDPARPDAMSARVEVTDFGHGMTEDSAAAAVEPFVTTRPGAPGLGLPMVRAFAAQSGGTFVLRSRLGEGTRVTLTFPLRASAGGRETTSHPERLAHPDARRVLVVDDNAALREGIARRLRNAGFVVAEAPDAPAALALLDQRFDAIVSDVVLPGEMDGFELARRARAVDPKTALVFVSGFISARQPELLANDEFSSFLRKPIDYDNLIAVLLGLIATRDLGPSGPGSSGPGSSGPGSSGPGSWGPGSWGNGRSQRRT